MKMFIYSSRAQKASLAIRVFYLESKGYER